MIYFYNSDNDNDKIKNPITIITSNVKRANRLAKITFKRYGYKGTPNLIAV